VEGETVRGAGRDRLLDVLALSAGALGRHDHPPGDHVDDRAAQLAAKRCRQASIGCCGRARRPRVELAVGLGVGGALLLVLATLGAGTAPQVLLWSALAYGFVNAVALRAPGGPRDRVRRVLCGGVRCRPV